MSKKIYKRKGMTNLSLHDRELREKRKAQEFPPVQLFRINIKEGEVRL